ncbi:MAG: S-methyl-5-thioribose-1-phosphate isomerase [Zoogloeaceae bacterium]|jgi:methylthioribose-1-phosphate isomerase|nr:S-methyl-5-thioribose-1-phosphate isomerase [Zoogloeaceae bacterium]
MKKTTPSPRPLRRSLDAEKQERVDILDQTQLPWRKVWLRLETLADAECAIRIMQVRGAPLIGVTAAYGLALALTRDASDDALNKAVIHLAAARPTAVNLAWALERMRAHLQHLPPDERSAAAWSEADAIAEEDARQNASIGAHGQKLLQNLAAGHPRRPLQLMTHCNAGWLATVERGTALAPVYAAHAAKIPLHVWVSETRPRNQGLLTAWELQQAGIPHTLIADNASGLLILQNRVDAVLVGADRIAANGDVANKIGSCLKALAAARQHTSFYVAAPSTTFDFSLASGADIPIEARDGEELRLISGLAANGKPAHLRQIAEGEAVYNPAFDITPASLVTAIITENGPCPANRAALALHHPDKWSSQTAKTT